MPGMPVFCIACSASFSSSGRAAWTFSSVTSGLSAAWASRAIKASATNKDLLFTLRCSLLGTREDQQNSPKERGGIELAQMRRKTGFKISKRGKKVGEKAGN